MTEARRAKEPALREATFPDCNYSFDTFSSCALEGVASVIAGIVGASIVIHSPQGCAMTVSSAYDAHEVDMTRRKVACTRLFENEVVMGASKKLRDTVVLADRTFGTEVIFVVGTCAADIIGEDIDGLCKSLQKEVRARLVPVLAGGFRGNEYDGMEECLARLMDLVDTSAEARINRSELSRLSEFELSSRSKQPKLPSSYGLFCEGKTNSKPKKFVNLVLPQASVNPTWWADLYWVVSVLERMGVGARVLTHNTPLEELKMVGESEGSLLMSLDSGYGFAKRLEKEFGVSILLENVPLPVGVENTKRWLMELGEFFSREDVAEEIARRGEERVLNILRKRALMIVPRYHNLQVAVCSDASMAISLLRMLSSELEMIPEAVAIRECSRMSSNHVRILLKKELMELGLDSLVIFDADGYKVSRMLEEVEVDAVFGSAWEKYIAEKAGVKLAFDIFTPTNRDVYLDRPYFGYEGMLNMLEIVANDWERAFRSKKIVY